MTDAPQNQISTRFGDRDDLPDALRERRRAAFARMDEDHANGSSTVIPSAPDIVKRQAALVELTRAFAEERDLEYVPLFNLGYTEWPEQDQRDFDALVDRELNVADLNPDAEQ